MKKLYISKTLRKVTCTIAGKKCPVDHEGVVFHDDYEPSMATMDVIPDYVHLSNLQAQRMVEAGRLQEGVIEFEEIVVTAPPVTVKVEEVVPAVVEAVAVELELEPEPDPEPAPEPAPEPKPKKAKGKTKEPKATTKGKGKKGDKET